MTKEHPSVVIFEKKNESFFRKKPAVTKIASFFNIRKGRNVKKNDHFLNNAVFVAG